jgi:hypothetical protein
MGLRSPYTIYCSWRYSRPRATPRIYRSLELRSRGRIRRTTYQEHPSFNSWVHVANILSRGPFITVRCDQSWTIVESSKAVGQTKEPKDVLMLEPVPDSGLPIQILPALKHREITTASK